MKRLKDLRQKKGELATQMRALLDKADTEKRALSTDEDAEYRKVEDQYDATNKDIEREERQLERERELAAGKLTAEDEERKKGGQGTETAKDERSAEARAFSRYLRVGPNNLTEVERRALNAGTDPEGGYLKAPLEWSKELIKAVDDQVFIRQLATKHTVTTADGLGAPSLDADMDDAEWTSELETGAEDTAMRFGKRELHPHPLAKRVKVSRKLSRLTAGGIDALVRDRLAYKHGITQEKAFMTGDGNKKPLGVFVASNDGIPTSRDVQTGSATDITGDAFLDAKYALKAAYWPKARWILHRDTVKRVRKLKTIADGQYLWQPGLAAGLQDRIADTPYIISEVAPNTFTTGKYVGIIGDFSWYWIADALSLEVQVLNELYAETNQVGYIGRLECDGMPVLSEAFIRLITN